MQNKCQGRTFHVLLVITLATAALSSSCGVADNPAAVSEPVADLERWLGPQVWEKKRSGPVISLGEPGAFDDMHVMSPFGAFWKGEYVLLYSGSRGAVAERVFQLGLARSADGVDFHKDEASPIYEFGDGKHSVLTPTLLRSADGNLLLEDGKLRMWFSSMDFQSADVLHTLHDATGVSITEWSEPSPPLLQHVYAPTLLKEGDTYHLWYTDVSSKPWVFRYAESRNGTDWRVRDEPVLTIDQDWEQGNLFYPTVVKADGVYLMWYASYWKQAENKTAIGFAVSADGLTWRKHPDNPVITPDPDLPWEYGYTSSQSLLRLDDGSWRIWYGTRKRAPYVNKYFAAGTATWSGPAQ